MWSFLRRVDSGTGQIGVHRGQDGLAVVQVLGRSPGGKPRLEYCTFETQVDDDTLTQAVRRLPNRRLPTVSVLPSTAYQMLLVEAPDVPELELRSAVRWRIKDLIDFHVDDAVIDVFQMPNRGRGGPEQMMYAIAARAEGVRSEVEAAEGAGLKLEVIDILELSLRNVAALIEEDQRGVALLYMAQGWGVLLLIRQGVMYLTRRIETGVEALEETGALRAELVAGIALEVRRSLDYVESHYEQSSIPALHAVGLGATDLEQLNRELGISVREVDVDSMFDCRVPISDEMRRQCLPAIGAALRHDSVTL